MQKKTILKVIATIIVILIVTFFLMLRGTWIPFQTFKISGIVSGKIVSESPKVPSRSRSGGSIELIP